QRVLEIDRAAKGCVVIRDEAGRAEFTPIEIRARCKRQRALCETLPGVGAATAHDSGVWVAAQRLHSGAQPIRSRHTVRVQDRDDLCSGLSCTFVLELVGGRWVASYHSHVRANAMQIL